MIEFIKTPSEYGEDMMKEGRIVLHDEATVTDVLEAMEKFFAMCGYILGGHLEVVEDEEEKKTNQL